MLASIATAADEVLRVEERVENGVRESAGQSRQGATDEKAVRERASDPSRP